MIDKMILNSTKTELTIVYTNGRTFGLYSSNGRVLDVLAWFLLPIESVCYDISWNGLVTSQDDTQVINIKQLKVG